MPESLRDWFHDQPEHERRAYLKLWAALDLGSLFAPSPCHGRVNGHDCPKCRAPKRARLARQPWQAKVVSLDAYRVDRDAA